MRAVTRLGLTGGIGSGKSTAAKMLCQYGAALIDADAISRQVTAPGGLAIEPIKQAFGAEFITSEGALDRDRMRSLAFSDPNSRQRLEHIVHPLVGQEIRHLAQTVEETGANLIVFDIPLLVESSRWRAELDKVLVIDCSEQTQIDRVMQRNGLSQEDVRQILRSQASRESRLRASDLVICNDGVDMGVLESLAQRVARRFGL